MPGCSTPSIRSRRRMRWRRHELHDDQRLVAVEVVDLGDRSGARGAPGGQRVVLEPRALQRQRPAVADQADVGQRLLGDELAARAGEDEHEVEVAVADLGRASSRRGRRRGARPAPAAARAGRRWSRRTAVRSPRATWRALALGREAGIREPAARLATAGPLSIGRARAGYRSPAAPRFQKRVDRCGGRCLSGARRAEALPRKGRNARRILGRTTGIDTHPGTALPAASSPFQPSKPDRRIMTDDSTKNSEALDEIGREGATRRDVFKAVGATALGAALLASAGFDPAMAQDLKKAGKPMKAAFSNAGLQASWCAQGKQAAEAWAQADECRDHLVRRRTRGHQAARRRSTTWPPRSGTSSRSRPSASARSPIPSRR